jgi:hypothetical protein
METAFDKIVELRSPRIKMNFGVGMRSAQARI